MYPPKVTDEEVHQLIRELADDGQLPSGAAVRDALQRHYPCRGGVTRIYRLLASECARRGSVPVSAIGIGLLALENRNLREQLKHAREREDTHRVYWNREVGQLRERVQSLELRMKQAVASGQFGEALHQDVQAAETRAD